MTGSAFYAWDFTAGGPVAIWFDMDYGDEDALYCLEQLSVEFRNDDGD